MKHKKATRGIGGYSQLFIFMVLEFQICYQVKFIVDRLVL